MGMTPAELARLKNLKDLTTLQQAVLEVFRDRLIFNDELTRRLWAEVFDGSTPDDHSWQTDLGELERKVQAIHDATE